jgi:hypothetical protein
MPAMPAMPAAMPALSASAMPEKTKLVIKKKLATIKLK